jgi:hypothetical protein
MRILQEGTPKSPLVKQWQFFLIGQSIPLEGGADGIFGSKTREATELFQRNNAVPVTGKVDNTTMAAALARGFVVVEEADSFPPKPDFSPLSGNSARRALFGAFEFEPRPTPGNPERIEILGDWIDENIVSVNVPQLRGVGVPTGNGTVASQGNVRFHSRAVNQLLALWSAWENEGLLGRVLTWGGAFEPRFVRGKATDKSLSVHAFGGAFDINMAFNPLGAEPARLDTRGSVRELVTLANRHGFFWGGHFNKRLDGMHFEVARLDG